MPVNSSITLDLAFGMDCTGSMASYIESAKTGIRTIARGIGNAGVSDVRFALVEYRDHPPQDTTFVTRTHDFTSFVPTMESWLNASAAAGGGDTPEAVADALRDVRDLTWRSHATKVCVFIADAPPHGLGNDGPCPCYLDPLSLSKQLANKGITLYMVGVEPNILSYKDFMSSLAYATGGQYVPLNNASSLVQVIIGGALEEVSLAVHQAQVDNMVQRQIAASGGATNTTAMASNIYNTMAADKVQSKHLQLNNADLPAPSETAIRYAGLPSVTAVKADVSGGTGTPGIPSSPASGGAYSVAEGAISKKQVHRMVMKSKARIS